MNEELEEIFWGHLEECLEHLAADFATRFPKGSRGSAKARAPIAEFCGVSVITVGRWLTGGESPVGVPYFKLLCFLQMLGYRVIELEKAPKERHAFIELIGYGVLAMEEATRLVGYSNQSTLSAVLRGKEAIRDAKRQVVFDLWQERKPALQEAKARARQIYGLKFQTKLRQTPATFGTPPGNQHHAVLRLMEGLLILLEEDSFEESLKAELAEHPEATKTILLLSSFLSDLSSRLLESNVRGRG